MKNIEKYIDKIADGWCFSSRCEWCPLYNISCSGNTRGFSAKESQRCRHLFQTWALSDVKDDSNPANVSEKDDAASNAMETSDKINKLFIDSDNVACFKTLLQRMLDTYQKKNHDYGDSFAESIRENGLVSAFTRMGDKWSRAKNLASMRPDYIKANGWECKSDTAAVKDESLIDTLLDQANYSLMTVMKLMEMSNQIDKHNAETTFS